MFAVHDYLVPGIQIMTVYSVAVDTVYGSVCACGAILSLILNPMLLTRHLKKKRNFTNSLFIHLCLADFATGLVGWSLLLTEDQLN